MVIERLCFRVLCQFNIDEVLKLVSQNGFIPYSIDPKESSLASVIQYQNQTSNFNFDHLIAIYDNTLLVGVLFLPVFEMVYDKKYIYCVQGSSGYILPEYRGVFGFVIDKLLESYPNTIKLFMFSAIAVQKTILKKEFYQVNHDDFSTNNYIVLRPLSFLKANIKSTVILKMISFFSFFDFFSCKLYYKQQFKSYENSGFEGDYSLIENDYYDENNNFIVPVWNAEVIKSKYLKTTEKISKNIPNNCTFHLVFEDSQKNIIGSLVARKIANYNRVVIVEIHSVKENRKIIIEDLISHLISKMISHGYSALMYNGIGKEYENIIKSNYITVKKKAEFKAFIRADVDVEINDFKSKIKLYYSTDDTNF